MRIWCEIRCELGRWGWGSKISLVPKSHTPFLFLILNNNKIAIYGASGKGQSLIQFCRLDNNIIEYVVDKSSLKHHKMTPGSHIPIYPTEYIYENIPDVILLCAWNFADEILKQEKRFISLGGKILHPLPMPHYLVWWM